MSKYNCLMYHEVNEVGDAYTVRPGCFKDQIALIQNLNYSAESISGINRLADPSGHIALSFDDGFASDLMTAEILSEKGFRATYFMVKSYADASDSKYLNAQQIKRISALGHEIGVHGKTHDWWTGFTLAELRTDLSETKTWLEDLCGVAVKSCSAVGGKLNKDILKMIQQENLFSYTRNSLPWSTSSGSAEVNSIAVLRADSLDQFKRKVIGDKYLYYKSLGIQKIKNTLKEVLNR